MMIDISLTSAASVAAMVVLALAFGFVLSLARLKLKVTKDPRIEKVLEALPGANCGACGMPGCSSYAARIIEENYAIDLCPVGGKNSAAAIAAILGVQYAGSASALTVRVHCRGGIAETVRRFAYRGPRECAAAHSLMGGPKVCAFGCLGFGDCVRACPFDALEMGENGLPIVSIERCTGCGLCVKACPRGIMQLVPAENDIHVMCRNTQKAADMKKGCSVGCIACKLCEKACRTALTEADPSRDPAAIVPAITVTDFLARIDYSLCIQCYRCVEVCPVPVIHPLERSKKHADAKKKAAVAVKQSSQNETGESVKAAQ